jgi:hypothetical protein
MKPKVLIATITAEMPRYYEYYDSLDRLILPPNSAKVSIHSSSPAKNRNIIISSALKTDFTHIFFTDDDHVYQPDTVMRLLARDVDIVSGLYCMKFPPFPLIALNNPNDANMSSFVNMQKYGPYDMFEVARVPAGCLLLRIDALRAMQRYFNKLIGYTVGSKIWTYWFTIGQIIKDEWGDDLWFCDKAREAGLKVYLDCAVRAGHLTKCILTPEYVSGEWRIQHKINSELGIEFIHQESSSEINQQESSIK